MEKIYLPPKIGHSLGVATMLMSTFTIYQAMECFGDARFAQGQAEIFQAAGQFEAENMAEENIRELRDRMLGNATVAMGFIGVSGLSFFLSSRQPR